MSTHSRREALGLVPLLAAALPAVGVASAAAPSTPAAPEPVGQHGHSGEDSDRIGQGGDNATGFRPYAGFVLI